MSFIYAMDSRPKLPSKKRAQEVSLQEFVRNPPARIREKDLQRTSDSESKEVEDVVPSLSSRARDCQPGSSHEKPIKYGAPQFGNSNTSCSQAQEGSHNSIVPFPNPAQDGSSRIPSWSGNNPLTPEEQHSESETTIQDHYIVDMDSISSGGNFHPGTFGVSNSYTPALVVINLAVPSDTGTQNPTADQNWLKISKLLIPVSAGAGYNSSSMFAKVANMLAFIAILTAIVLKPTRSRAIRILTKFGAIACAAGTLAAIGHDLPHDYWWASGVAFLIPAVAVAVA